MGKTKIFNIYFLYDVLGMIVYVLILYFGFSWLAQFSLIYANLWNFALIIIAITFDRYADKIMQSEEIIKKIKDNRDIEKFSRMVMGGFISFKSLLYLLYLFILIASQIVNFNSALIGENLSNFIQANNYGILFLLAFDTFIAQLTKDREKMIKFSEKLKNQINE